LVLALQEIDLFLSDRRDAQLNRAQDEAIDVTQELPATWGFVEPTDAGPCGCHASWTEHYEGWDYSCKCHNTKAEHAAELRATTPDTVWWKTADRDQA